jgi:nucleoside-diphosphate kinase
MTAGWQVDWTRWTVILLKPDCLARGLAEKVFARVAAEVTVIDYRIVNPTEEQIFAHYQDLLTTRLNHFTWVDVAGDLRRSYVGQHAGGAATRLRAVLGHFDPAQAGPATIRGHFGQDSLRRAQAEHRLIANLIHSSDNPAGARREFGIWYGPAGRHLLHEHHACP